ncbi:MAG: ribonuclease Y [Candidatus Theseobacter exili]|nr:ribonuclease Y [Candidatus Theseobacter exili]
MANLFTNNGGIMLILGILLGIVFGFVIGGILSKLKQKSIGGAAENVLEQARREAQSMKKEAKIETQDEIFTVRREFEKETKERRQEMLNLEKRVRQKEESLERKVDVLEKKENEIVNKEKGLRDAQSQVTERVRKLDELIEEEREKLQSVSGMSSEEAKQILLSRLEDQVRHDASAMIRQIEAEAKETASKKSKDIIIQAIQRYAGEVVSESTVTTVALPSDEMKGKIIGREGRNIRAIEAAMGIDVIIDDTPEAVVLSGFDPVRREIARIALERLIADGRIHPARIEEVASKVKKEMDTTIRETGEQTVFELGLHGIHPEIVKLLGRLKYRTSFGQNVLKHSQEVAYVMGIMAAELNLDIQMAKRIGLLHDIGKAVDHEVEGSHAIIGADLAKKYGENPELVLALRAHHNEEEAQTLFSVLIQAGDALSAARPGARSETLQTYIKRLEKLEEIAGSFLGVDKSFAIQAGREVRVMVIPEQVSDDEANKIARDIAVRVQDELDYPGQIKVMVVRETRAVEYAR